MNEQPDDRVTINRVGLSCSTCFYWTPSLPREDGQGRCSRYPPSPRYVPEIGAVLGAVCFTPGDYCCGEWKTDAEPPPELGLAELADG